MRIVSLVFCIIIIVLAVFFIATDHADALFSNGSSNPPLVLVLILAVIGLVANLKKQY